MLHSISLQCILEINEVRFLESTCWTKCTMHCQLALPLQFMLFIYCFVCLTVLLLFYKVNCRYLKFKNLPNPCWYARKLRREINTSGHFRNSLLLYHWIKPIYCCNEIRQSKDREWLVCLHCRSIGEVVCSKIQGTNCFAAKGQEENTFFFLSPYPAEHYRTIKLRGKRGRWAGINGLILSRKHLELVNIWGRRPS